MCHHCVVESVKERMLSRRSLFQAAGLAAAAAAVSTVAPAPAAAEVMAKGRPIDLTHALTPEFPTYFGAQQFWVEQKFNWAEHKFNLNEWRLNEHTGTHMDAPLHFSENGASVGAIPVDKLICPLCVIDIRAKASASADAEVTPDDIKAWTSANGPIPAGACIAMLSGWDAHVGTDKFRNVDGEKKMHFPGFHIEAAKMLMEDGNAVGMAVDTLSLDFGMSGDFATHYAWLPSGRWGMENVANLAAVPAKGATAIIAAPKVATGTGGLTRMIAIA